MCACACVCVSVSFLAAAQNYSQTQEFGRLGFNPREWRWRAEEQEEIVTGYERMLFLKKSSGKMEDLPADL